MGSFDCVAVRFASSNFAQDDSTKANQDYGPPVRYADG
jgi:hypothetical protein